MYTTDWVTSNIPTWNKLFGTYKEKPTSMLEIGSFEGRSTVWFCENILSHQKSRLTCIDPFWDHDYYHRFLINTDHVSHKFDIYKGHSSTILPQLISLKRQFDIIYIDGSHRPLDIMLDAILSKSLLVPNGIILFDDYDWQNGPSLEVKPKPVIDAFVSFIKAEVLHKGYQLAIRC